MKIGDVVKVNVDLAADTEYWERYRDVTGIVLDYAEDDLVKVKWGEDCGLTLHWAMGALIVIGEDER